MADITKKGDRGIPKNERSVSFTQADAGAGDVLMINDSMGKPGTKVVIESAGGMSVRFNVYRTVAPLRKAGDGLGGSVHGFTENLALAQTVKDETNAVFSIAASGSLELDDDMPIRDIEIVSATGDFTITCI
jgi:hypothetical protein